MALDVVPVAHVETGRLLERPDDDPDETLTELARRFGRVALVDALGVRRNQPDLELLQALSRRRSVWADAGSRYATDAMDLFIAGAETVTMRWNTLHDAGELEEAAALCQPGSLFVGVEYPRGVFLRHPRDPLPAADVVRLADRLGIGVVFILDRADASLLRGLPAATVPRWVQGSTRGLRDDLQAWGFQGILATADEWGEEGSA